MGYTTSFSGSLKSDKPIQYAHKVYINLFAETRRMKRKKSSTILLSDFARLEADLPVGKDGGYFVGGQGFSGQQIDDSVLDSNSPPAGQPSLWCQWIVDENGEIVWDRNEKFYYYTEWLRYLITHFFSVWGYSLNGEIFWQGEESDDFGKIIVRNNKVTTKKGIRSYR
jgi:hypothetical protein